MAKTYVFIKIRLIFLFRWQLNNFSEILKRRKTSRITLYGIHHDKVWEILRPPDSAEGPEKLH